MAGSVSQAMRGPKGFRVSGPIRVLVVFGTRPEAIKLSPVVWELKARPDLYETIVVVTGQHRELLRQPLSLFGIVPDHDLEIMEEGQSLFDVTIKSLERLKGIMERTRPDLVLVQGDTTTAFATALAAYYLGIPVGHVEAGLRTGDRYNPFPEELNRHLITVLASIHFAPTESARQNLLKEGVDERAIFLTGNTVVDALRLVKAMGNGRLDPRLKKINFRRSKVITVTAHRRESFGKPMSRIMEALKRLATCGENLEVVLQVHLNPNVRRPVERILQGTPRVHLLEPLDYLPFVQLMARSYLVLTDSGGVQEEAPALGVPVLVLREKTERPEGIEFGAARLVGTGVDSIVDNTLRLIRSPGEYRAMARARKLYGDGWAAKRIVSVIKAQAAKGFRPVPGVRALHPSSMSAKERK